MSTDYGFKVDGWGASWNGPDHMVEGRRVGRLTKLKALLEALKSADMAGAQKALDDLWSFDPTLKQDPYLMKIGDALSRKLLYVAQKTAASMQADVHHFSYTAQIKAKLNAVRGNSESITTRSGPVGLLPPQSLQYPQAHSEQVHKKATTGEFGRIIDVSA